MSTCTVYGIMLASIGLRYNVSNTHHIAFSGLTLSHSLLLVVFDPASRKYIMHLSEIEGSCGGVSWETNSRCSLATKGEHCTVKESQTALHL